MSIINIGLFLFVLLFIYLFISSYFFQVLYHKLKIKKLFIREFKLEVKGIYYPEGYFTVGHHFVTNEEYKSFSNRHKSLFSKCYNIVTFKTVDAYWELFFHLVKDGNSYSEILNIRVFPKYLRIKSEGNVEKNYSRLNIFTNNRYLTSVLENSSSDDFLNWLIRHNGDILLISHNNLHFKAFLSSKKLTVSRALDMVKALNGLKSNIYKKDIIEY